VSIALSAVRIFVHLPVLPLLVPVLPLEAALMHLPHAVVHIPAANLQIEKIEAATYV